jgi:hypothetical protein
MINSQNAFGAFSAQALLAWGLEDVAYVRPTEADGKPAYMICAADGAEIAVFDDREVAFAACRQHELEPLSVH